MQMNEIFLRFLDNNDLSGFKKFVTPENHKLLFRCMVGDTEIRRKPIMNLYFDVITRKFPDVVYEIDGLEKYIVDDRISSKIYEFEFKKLHTLVQVYMNLRDENCSELRPSLAHIPTSARFLRKTCDFLPLEDVKHVYGPVSYNEFRLGGKAIGIFGEDHNIPVKYVDKATTLTPAALLNSILKSKPDVFYDLFLEYPFKPTKEYKIDSGLHWFDHLFGDCFQFHKKCPYPNLRLHSTDYRDVLPVGDFFISLINTIPDNPDNLRFRRDQIRATVYYYFMNDPKIAKEIRYVRDPVTRYFNDEITTLNRISEKALLDYSDRPTVSNLKYVYRVILWYLSLIMDVYTIGRMFKSFDTRDSLHPAVAENCIIYVGDNHAHEYEKILKSYMGIEPIISLYSDDQVLTFSEDVKMKSFLFT
jgi:hypothetical protein